MPNKKIRTLLIYQLLEKYSDENHPLCGARLIELLAEKGIDCDRKSIYRDIDALKEIGFDILFVKGRGSNGGYFLASRKFQLPEVVLLIDAVTSAGFITPKKTAALVDKLKSLVSEEQAKSLVSQVYVNPTASKCDNEEIYIIIDSLHDAIIQRHKVSFTYRRRNVDFRKNRKFTDKSFKVSPYALIWKDDHYYLVCNNEKYDNLMNLRIDRMKKLHILNESARHISEVSAYTSEFDTQDYSSKMFNMFSGEDCEVSLICDYNLLEEMLDRFGVSIPLSYHDTEHFKTTVNATLSDGFVSWLMQYGSAVCVLSPPELVDMIKQKAQSITDVYK
ncbi:MAG: WYL domain-containing transcriptional regulator [Eubacterium sp.]|nr:WYL domain-containing transcriptional regulator [Eubacterium sp.]MDE6155450.1 WYL domain-containing transcriptional regulator [Eubacterium sp.]